MVGNDDLGFFGFEVGFLVEAIASEGAGFALTGFTVAGYLVPYFGRDFLVEVSASATLIGSRPYIDGLDEGDFVLGFLGVIKDREDTFSVDEKVPEFVLTEVVGSTCENGVFGFFSGDFFGDGENDGEVF